MKKLIIGIIIGILIASVLPVGAAIQEYILYKSDCTLIIDGQPYNNPDLPMLNYKGYNYIPVASFKDIVKNIGASFNFDNDTKEVQVMTTATKTDTTSPTELQYDAVTGLPIGAEYVTREYNGKEYQLIQLNDELYINTTDLRVIFGITQGHLDVAAGTRTFLKGDSVVTTIPINTTNVFFVGIKAYYKISLFDGLTGE